jgi:arginyl-tRNA synthetase
MLNITNKSDEEINALITKYTNILEIFKPETKPYIAYLIDICVNHFKENYKNLNNYWKAWSVVVVKKYFDSVKTEADVKKIIDDFILFHTAKYQQYCDYTTSANDWDKDEGFMLYFLNR